MDGRHGIEDAVVDLIGAKGPCTGFEIEEELNADSLLLWRTCRSSGRLDVRRLGKRYMRLDRHVDGFARLSPSILREFLTYSVVGLAGDSGPLDEKCREVDRRIRQISRYKYELARRTVSEIMEEFEEGKDRADQICFVIAGDIVYDMAHDVPRPERSTGKLVRGSDIDLVVVVDDDLPESCIRGLDELIYRKKYRMLIDPAVNEEIDYKIKRVALIREQASFDDFKRMVAIKILGEGLLLYGSESLYGTVRGILEERNLSERLDDLESLARSFRDRAEELIMNDSVDREKIKKMHLFYSTEEYEEFE